MHELAYQVLSHARAMWRYRWFAVLLAWIIALGGWAAVHRMPDRYEASARVWLNTQSVIKHLLAGLTAQPNIDQTVVMLSRTLISRPNLEKVIQMAALDAEIKTPLQRELLTTRLMKEVTILSAGADNLFTIAYTDKNPQKAKLVVQSLLTIFVESSLGDQRKDSEEAQHFIDEELKVAQEKMDIAEEAMIAFKRRQTGLKSGRGDYSVQLVAAEAALSEAKLELKIAEINRDARKKSLPDEEEIPSLLGDTGTEAAVRPEIDVRIGALEQKLDALRLTYTDDHPDVVSLLRTIAQLKQQKKTEPVQKRASSIAVPVPAPGHQQLALALAATEADVAAAKTRVEEYERRYSELKAAASAAPQIDADFNEVTRAYEMAKGNYSALLTRREQARISAKLEVKTSAADFRVIDPPQVSSMPKAPNRQLLNSVVLLMAIAGGMALAFVLSQVRPTFDDERRLKEVSGIPVLGTVNMSWTVAQKARRIRGLVALTLTFVSLLSAYAAINVALTLMAARA